MGVVRKRWALAVLCYCFERVGTELSQVTDQAG